LFSFGLAARNMLGRDGRKRLREWLGSRSPSAKIARFVIVVLILATAVHIIVTIVHFAD
jgi:hypothetical protein